jgi:glycosyltransferase involved in cell wall biosynthesis
METQEKKAIKISCVLSIRNGEKYILYLKELFDRIENENKDLIFEFFIYENNSTDNTKEAIEYFAKNKNGRFYIEDLPNNTMKSGISEERGQHMAMIRNKLKDLHGALESDYVLLLDCDTAFTGKTIRDLLNTLQENEDVVMVSPFCMCWEAYITNSFIHYYDTFAFITQDGDSYKEMNSSCLYNGCDLCRHNRKCDNILVEDSKLFDTDLVQVRSAFGSMSLMKTDVYNKVRWGNSICEHHSFCEEVNKYGKIVFNPKIKTCVTIPGLSNYQVMHYILENTLQ